MATVSTEPRNFKKLLQGRWDSDARVCVGLDADILKMDTGDLPRHSLAEMIFRRCVAVVDATKDLALAYKPNLAFFSEVGAFNELTMLIQYINKVAPGVPVILDAKYGDIGNTNSKYVKFAFDLNAADAVTIHATLGYEAMKPFLVDPNKFAFVLCKTSNPGSGEFQDEWVRLRNSTQKKALGTAKEPEHAQQFELTAHNVATTWNANGNAGLVVGATYPRQLARVRSIVGEEMWILVPGVGTQGGDVKKTVKAGGDKILVNSSSGIMFGKKSPRQEALILTGALLAAA